jgi:hypothetical protein
MSIIDHPASSDMSTPLKELWPVLIRVIPSSSGRPRYPGGQYVPTGVIDANRQEGLNALLGPYSPVKIEQCLNPQTGKPFADYYLASFPDFDAVHGAQSAWNAVELAENPYISMLIMEDIDEDTKTRKLLEKGWELEKDVVHSELAPVAKVKTSTVFEEWWATSDMGHWAEHEKRIRRQNEGSTKGVWLYKGEPGDAHYFKDVASFSYTAPAIIEYDIRRRKEVHEEAVEYIDWDTTRKAGRLTLTISKAESSTLIRIAHEGESSSSDDEEEGKKGDTSDTTPPSSPPMDPTNVSQHVAEINKDTDVTIRSNSEMSPDPHGESQDIIVTSAKIDADDEDPVEKFKRALAKSGIRMSTESAVRKVSPNKAPATPPLQAVIPHVTGTPQPGHASKGQDSIPLPGASGPGLPFSHVSYQYPHFFVGHHTDGVVQPPTSKSSTLGERTRSVLADEGQHREVDMRAYCWQKYGFDIEDIRVDGLAALQPQSATPTVHALEKASVIKTGELEVWKILGESARTLKVAEEDHIRETHLAAALQPQTAFAQETHTAGLGEQFAVARNDISEPTTTTSPSACATVPTELHIDNSSAEDLSSGVSFAIENMAAVLLSDDVEEDPVDPGDTSYAQLYGNPSKEIEVYEQNRTDTDNLPVDDPTTQIVPILTQDDVIFPAVGEQEYDVELGTNVEAKAKPSEQCKTGVDDEPASTELYQGQEEPHTTPGHILDVSKGVIARSSDPEVISIVCSNVNGRAEISQHTEYRLLKFALLLFLDYFSLGLLSKLLTHPFAFFMLVVYVILEDWRTGGGLMGWF